MKKPWLFGVLIGLIGWFPARAQVEDGARYWGGTVNLSGNVENNRGSNTNSNENKHQLHSITPELQWGKLINSTTMIGLGSRYGFSWNRSTSAPLSSPSSLSKQTTVGQSVALLPFVRKYKLLGERWAVFLNAEAGPTYNWQKSVASGNQNYSAKSHFWKYELSIKPGLTYFLSKKNLAIEGYVNILSLNTSYTGFSEDGGRQLAFNTGFSTDFPSYFTLRIAKYLPAKPN